MLELEHVEPQRDDAKNSPKATEAEGQKSLEAVSGDTFCYWNDKKYSDGANVCENKRRFSCWSGKWVDIGNC